MMIDDYVTQAKWDALTAECDQLRAALAAVTAERDKLREACDVAYKWIANNAPWDIEQDEILGTLELALYPEK